MLVLLCCFAFWCRVVCPADISHLKEIENKRIHHMAYKVLDAEWYKQLKK